MHNDRRGLPLQITGALDSAQRIAAIPVADNGRGGLVHVADIAAVRKRWQDPPEQIALHDGRRSLLVAVRTEQDVHLDRWAEQARATASAFATELDSEIVLDTVFDQSHYCRTPGRAGRQPARRRNRSRRSRWP